jgi:hypothetical protein
MVAIIVPRSRLASWRQSDISGVAVRLGTERAPSLEEGRALVQAKAGAPGAQSCDRVSSDLPWGATTGCDPPSEDARRLRCTSKLSDKAEGLRNLHPPVQIRAAPPFQTLMNEGTSG